MRIGRRTGIGLAVVACAVALATPVALAHRSATPSNGPGNIANGFQVFNNYFCVACHVMKAAGPASYRGYNVCNGDTACNLGMNFNKIHAPYPVAVATVTNGLPAALPLYPTQMVGFGKVLTQTQIQDVSAFLDEVLGRLQDLHRVRGHHARGLPDGAENRPRQQLDARPQCSRKAPPAAGLFVSPLASLAAQPATWDNGEHAPLLPPLVLVGSRLRAATGAGGRQGPPPFKVTLDPGGDLPASAPAGRRPGRHFSTTLRLFAIGTVLGFPDRRRWGRWRSLGPAEGRLQLRRGRVQRDDEHPDRDEAAGRHDHRRRHQRLALEGDLVRSRAAPGSSRASRGRSRSRPAGRGRGRLQAAENAVAAELGRAQAGFVFIYVRRNSDERRSIGKVVKSEAEWRAELDPSSTTSCARRAPSAPFTGEYDHVFEPGTYRCAGCGEELFASDAKYDSGCGWPASSRRRARRRSTRRPTRATAWCAPR